MDISDFFIEKGFTLTLPERVVPKGRGKFQYICEMNEKPSDVIIEELEEKFGYLVLKNNYRKGKELTLFVKKDDTPKPELLKKNEESVEMNLKNTTEIIFSKKENLTRSEINNILSQFQNVAYTKGFNAHKVATEKALGMSLNQYVTQESNGSNK